MSRRRIWLSGLIAILALYGCGGGSNSSTPAAQAVAVSISPAAVTLSPRSTEQFTATVTGTTDTAVTWEVNSTNGGNSTVGTVSTTGLYTAPATIPNPHSVFVVAVSQADPSKSGSATVTIAKPAGAANQAAQTFPVKLGTSGGNVNDTTFSGGKEFCCSGTLGSLVSRGGTLFILSNNHVLAKSNQGKVGDIISQPGLVDTNCSPGQPVGNLSQFVNLPSGGTGTADAALAQIITGAVNASGAILEVGVPASTVEPPVVTMRVAKAGRTTGLTCSSIQSINTSTQVQYSTSCNGGTNFNVNFNNQIVVSGASFSGGGDSGSLIVDATTAQPVGLLYAGDTTSTVANPIASVLAALKDSNGVAPIMVGGGLHSVACPAGSAAAQTVVPTQAATARATEISRRHETEIFSNPGVLKVGVGASQDSPGEAAILLYADRSRLSQPLPAVIEGVRTKIISRSPSQMESEAATNRREALPGEEMARASAVKERIAGRLLRNGAVFGVGVGISEDSPGESAIVLFVDSSKPYAAPAILNGVRTKVVRGEPFRAYGWNERKKTQPACLHSSSAVKSDWWNDNRL